jgi:thiol:disulfide interchange protein DsbA
MKTKFFILTSILVLLSGCFGKTEKLPRVEPTSLGYDILHLTDKSKKLFPKLQKNEIEVTYYFAWGCPHCNQFHPYLLKWIANDDNFNTVTFRKTPVSLLPNWVDLSRLYYVAQEKGFLEQLDVPLFQALHRKNKPLSDWIEDIAKFATPFAKKVDSSLTTEHLIDLMESDTLNNQILSDNNKVLALMLHTTPVIVVRFNDNFYNINTKTSIKNNGIINTLNQLIVSLK